MFSFTTDREAEAKIHDVVGLFLQPPTNAVVLSVDENTQIHVLKRTQPILPLRPGLPSRQTHDYTRHSLTSLYAALEVASGTVPARAPRAAAPGPTPRFQNGWHRRYRTRDLQVILDHSPTRKITEVRGWMAAHPRVHFNFAPTGPPWLNMVGALRAANYSRRQI
jgi:hypothetical protein